MAEALVLEFTGIGESDYQAVNDNLGVDMASRVGLPDGMLSHGAGTTDEGTFVVLEVWESREAQGAFMASRLGGALAAAGVTQMPKITWVPLFAYFTFGD
jgi:quinol monooxygenase YgiN